MLAMSITKDEITPLIEVNKQALMNSFNDLQRANEDTADLQMREINKEAETQRATQVQTKS